MSCVPSRRTKWAGAAIFLTSVLALSACSGTGADDTASGDTEVVVYTGVTGDFAENFNPFIVGSLQSTQGMIYEPLFYYNIVTGADPEPLLGTEFGFNDDGTVLTVSTREGAEWSDGEPFSASDVAYTFDLLKEVPAFNIAGFDGEVTQPDDNTVVFTFDEPAFMNAPAFLGNTPIIPEHVWSVMDSPTTNQNASPVGSGAFQLAEFNPQNYVLAANETYWGGEPDVDALRFISLTGNQSATDTLLSGQIDWAGIFLPDIDQIFEGTSLTYTNTPLNQTALFTCSNAALGCTGPQTDVAVREAIYNGLNRDQLNALAFSGYNGTMSPTYALLGRDDKWIAPEFSEPVPGEPNIEAADTVLLDAGYAKGSDGIYAKDGQRVSMTVQVVTGWTDYIAAMEAAAQQLLEVGIELKPAQVSFQEWTSSKTSGTFELSLDSVPQGVAADPYYVYLNSFASKNTAPVGETSNRNYVRYSNPIVDAAIEAASSAATDDAKLAEYATIQTEIVRDMPYIPVLVNSALSIFNEEKVTGWPTEENMYAYPRPDRSWDNGMVAKNLKVVN
ncbi:ABC transporter substrate-binding protein [Cryobacterium melibiosiphilum]|uniref:ABC transporter substrate-binding protein n=1 Tax=Cryobacterium melibiosiphilum TaxID=995039 RepID=A0A3A5MPU7_9MICO|nr:ABC transporter substrate-binding protein [Cryobacterium melibiosiphilum]RJT88983.1 ABC transporter substrate-binding protein [Cryobacterium melibiosiphilum]